MPKQLWECDDGMVFGTYDEATKHDAELEAMEDVTNLINKILTEHNCIYRFDHYTLNNIADFLVMTDAAARISALVNGT